MLQYQITNEIDNVNVRDDVLHFHVGLPKTGTTLLQHRLFPHHKQIDYLGKFEPNHRFKTPAIAQWVTDTLRRGVFGCDVEQNRRLFDSEIRPLMGLGRAVLMSFEDGSHGSPRRRRAKLANLQAVCGECRLLITLRHPLAFVESMYLQRLKKLNTISRRWLSPPWVPTIDEWLVECWSRGEKAELSHLDYAEFISDWENTFGAESVCVLLYEDLRKSPASYLDDVCRFLGIQGVQSENFFEGKPVNPRLTVPQVQRIHSLASSPVGALLFRVANGTVRQRLLGASSGPGARVPLPPHWSNRIRQLTIPGNRTLIEQCKLPLAEYGYPV